MGEKFPYLIFFSTLCFGTFLVCFLKFELGLSMNTFGFWMFYVQCIGAYVIVLFGIDNLRRKDWKKNTPQ